MNIYAVILAGGMGTRLGTLTQSTPKPLVRVRNQPFLYWQLSHLRDQGVREVLLLVSHLAHMIKEHFDSQPISGLRIAYSEEPQPMGTGGALRWALSHLPEQFWLVNGDSYMELDLAAMYQQCLTVQTSACMAVTDTNLVPVGANVHISDKHVLAYQKDALPDTGFTQVDAGVYLLNRNVVANGPTGKFDLGALWPPLIASRQLGAYAAGKPFFDIGTPERLRVFETYLTGR